MKKKYEMKKLTIYFILLVVVVGGCKKYEEGPLISLRSKENRLCKEWELDKLILDGETNDEINDFIWKIEKNGSIQLKMLVNSIEHKATSEWRWTNDKESIEIKPFVNSNRNDSIFNILRITSYKSDEWSTLTIIKLKSKELVFEAIEDEEEVRIEFLNKE